MHLPFKKLSHILVTLSLLANLVNVAPFVFPLSPTVAHAADDTTIDTIKKNIDTKNAQIEALNQEINELNNQIQSTTKQAQTLKSAISTLDASRTKLSKDIQVTQTKVGTANLTIEQLGLEMDDKARRIARNKVVLADTIRNINQAEESSLVETVLAYKNVTELWNEIESLNRFQIGLQENTATVEDLKEQLAQKQAENVAQRKKLLDLQNQLVDQKKIVETNKTDKSKLLTSTQSQEAAYQKQLALKKQQAEAFLQELNAYESQLKFIIDPTSYPSSGKGILHWPLQSVYVTQYFGDTEFAKTTNAYNGKGHNGVDFRASAGTNVLAALDGTVEGIGNTDAVPGCYSYGKWVLIRHDNGLSTLYAHLSLQKVVAGQRVKTGEVIGYSGYTGYVVPAGPSGAHLHFGVYATQGVKIVQYTNSINCKNAFIPVADLKAYLNPLTYL